MTPLDDRKEKHQPRTLAPYGLLGPPASSRFGLAPVTPENGFIVSRNAYHIECLYCGTRWGFYLSRETADCPWCGALHRRQSARGDTQ